MKIKGAAVFLKGIGLKNIKPALYAWFINFLFSLSIYLGYYKVFVNAAGDSVIAGDIGGQTGLFSFIADIAVNYSGNLSLMFFIGICAALLFFSVTIYVCGGIYSVLVEDERATFTNLAASSTENFFLMLKVFLGNIPVWLGALIIPGMLAASFPNIPSLIFSERAIGFYMYLFVGITALLFAFATAVYDFSRIFQLKEGKSLFQTVKKAIGFTLSNKLGILVIFLLYGLSLLLFYLVYMIFTNMLEHLLHIFLVFAVYQGFMMVRYYLKVVVIRAEIGLTE
jgi:hypothetical protein